MSGQSWKFDSFHAYGDFEHVWPNRGPELSGGRKLKFEIACDFCPILWAHCSSLSCDDLLCHSVTQARGNSYLSHNFPFARLLLAQRGTTRAPWHLCYMRRTQGSWPPPAGWAGGLGPFALALRLHNCHEKLHALPWHTSI